MQAKKSIRALSLTFIVALTANAPFALPAQAECYEVAPVRPVHRTYIRRDVAEPGVYGVYRRPPVYGWVRTKVCDECDGSARYAYRRVLLRPYKNIVDYQRPGIVYSRERLAIMPELPDC
jgi:hypothetical protein